MTQVKLLGELGEKFGADWQSAGSTMRDILKLIDCQVDGFQEYLQECHKNNVGFTIQNGQDFIEDEIEMYLPNAKDTVIISPVPAGSGKGLGKILAAIAIITVMVMSGGTATAGLEGAKVGAAESVKAFGMEIGTATMGETGKAAVSLNWKGNALMSLGANLGIMGITQMTAPDSGSSVKDPSYLFNGADQNIEQGTPIPVLYGTMKIGGTPISQGFAAGAITGIKTAIDGNIVSSVGAGNTGGSGGTIGVGGGGAGGGVGIGDGKGSVALR